MEILIFAIVSLVFVVLSVLRTILTVKGTVLNSASMSAITFGFYTLVLKQISNTDLIISVPIIISTNFIGVYIANYLLNKLKKDKLWKISCTLPNKDNIDINKILHELENNNIKYTVLDYPQGKILEIFSYQQKQSHIIKSLLQGCKFTVTETKITL